MGARHRRDVRGVQSSPGKGGVKTFFDGRQPDGKNEDFHGMELRAAAEAKERGDAGPGFGEPWNENSRARFDDSAGKPVLQGRPGVATVPRGGPKPESGSEILDYQEPMEMAQRTGRKRKLSRDSQDPDC